MRRIFAWAGVLAYAAGSMTMLALSDLLKDAEGLAFTAAFGAFPVVGLIILLRRPENPLGWVFCTVGLLAGGGLFSWSYSEYSYYEATEPLPLSLLVAWAGSWFWYPLIATIVTLPLMLFPDGLLSRRWKPVLWTTIALIAVATVVTATPKTFTAGEDEGDRNMLVLENPVGLYEVDGSVEDMAFMQFTWLALLVLIVLGVVSLILRFRRSEGRERLQMKWFTYAAAVMVVNMVAGSAFPAFDDSFVSGALFVIAIAAFPVTCGIAIVKHQLYQIDVIINRTLVYGSLTALLVALYVGIVFVLGSILGPLAEDSDIAIAASTLAVAAIFRPLRSRVQSFIDRRFYRRRYDAERTLSAFATRLRDEVDTDTIQRDVVRVVGETFTPSGASLWLRNGAAIS